MPSKSHLKHKSTRLPLPLCAAERSNVASNLTANALGNVACCRANLMIKLLA